MIIKLNIPYIINSVFLFFLIKLISKLNGKKHKINNTNKTK